MKSYVWSLLTASAWLAGVVGGFYVVCQYEQTPGPGAVAQPSWPSGSGLQMEPGRACLVMLAHPRCPCTRASVESLARIMDRQRGRLTAHVLLLQPVEFAEEWSDTDLKRQAEHIPGVQVHRDVGGVEAHRFGGATSGQVLVYGADGRLLFRGGITDGRGKAGRGAGAHAITALLAGETRPIVETPVFGCPLFD